MADDIQNGWGAQALDQTATQRALAGDYVRSGCAASDGANALEVDIAAGEIQIDGSLVDVAAQTVTLTAGSGDPRKDVIYLDTTGTTQVVGGTPEPALPSGETRRQTYQPQPVDLSGTVGIVVAEVWVPAGASDISSGDISDRRPLIGVGVVPPGTITLWSGAIADIPAGWALCDGNNGTPDLRDRFVTGAGGQYTVGATGGEDAHTLTEGELPSHAHTVPFVETENIGQPLHIGGERGFLDNSDTSNTTGNDEAHENRPPYHALAYIMKL